MIRDATLFIATIMIFVIFNVMIYQKQKILRTGETVYLSIAPVDPRSLMQGDYMTFRYLLEDDIKKVATPATQGGYLVIATNENGVGEFVKFYQGETLNTNEKLLQYRFHPNNFAPYTIKPNTFFFQEKLQPNFQQAKFAVFHYQGEKNYLLTGLADQERKIISGK